MLSKKEVEETVKLQKSLFLFLQIFSSSTANWPAHSQSFQGSNSGSPSVQEI